ncbi:MAG TPA: nitroreductase/quinone reductase family protein [Ktedonobacterales bacterium]
MAKPYRITAFVRFNNTIMSSLIRRGVSVGGFALLTVRGRTSGRLIETPVALFEQDGQRYLIAAYGLVNWVRNLRAAGGAASVTRRRETARIHAVELDPMAAALILRASLRAGPPGVPAPIVWLYRRYFVLPYLDVSASDPLPAFEREALAHPVFLVRETP